MKIPIAYFTFLLLLLTLSAYTQGRSKDTVVIAFNEELLATTPDKAEFSGYAVRSGNLWAAVIYDPSMRVIARGSYTSQKCKTREGWFTFYYPDGKRAGSGQYRQDKKQGVWRTWYPSGQLRDSLTYNKDLPHGPYYAFFESGKISGFGNYAEGIEDQTWTWYHSNGVVSSVEEFSKGKLIGQRCTDSTGKKQLKHCELYEEPTTADEKTIWQLVYGGEMPKDEFGQPIDGVVMLDIHITETGEVKKLEVVPSGFSRLDSAVKKVLPHQTKWNPAYNHNRPIAYVRTITIPFGSKAWKRNNNMSINHPRNYHDWYGGKIPQGYYWNVDRAGGFREL